MTQTILPGQSGLPTENPTQSYWHKEPSEKLLGHRTTEHLPASADVVIVGSGISGAFAAHALKEKRPELNVVMLEAREACWGATGRNGGHCQPMVYLQEPHVASFELRNYSYIKNLVETLSIPCDWRSTSSVHAYYSPELWAAAQKTVTRLKDKYPDLAANVSLVKKGKDGSPAWLLEDERKEMTLDALRIGNADGAVVQWEAASLWPYKLVAFVLEQLLKLDGFNLQTNTPAIGLSKVVGGSNTQNHPWTVHTPRGNISASQVLLCTNAYTSHLLPQFSDLIVPVRGQVSSLKPPQEPSPTQPPLDIVHTYAVIAGWADDYLIQRPPPAAELVFGGGRAHAKDNGVGVFDDSSIDDPVAWYLRGELSEMVDLSIHEPPASAHHHAGASAPTTKTTTTTGDDKEEQGNEKVSKRDLTPTHEWTGIMGYSRDKHPWVGAVPSSLGGGKGLWLCGGYTGHGMPNAALCAKAVVELMLSVMVGSDDEVDIPMEFLITEDRVSEARLTKVVGEQEEEFGGAFAFGPSGL